MTYTFMIEDLLEASLRMITSEERPYIKPAVRFRPLTPDEAVETEPSTTRINDTEQLCMTA